MSKSENTESSAWCRRICFRTAVSVKSSAYPERQVWKAINQLKEEGYEIEAVHNKGYRLQVCPDIISAEEVKSRLHTDWAGCEVRYFDTLDSTNICAKRMAEEGAPNGTLVIAG